METVSEGMGQEMNEYIDKMHEKINELIKEIEVLKGNNCNCYENRKGCRSCVTLIKIDLKLKKNEIYKKEKEVSRIYNELGKLFEKDANENWK